MSRERIAFDTSLYPKDDSASLADDLAAYALELEKGITPFAYRVNKDGRVVTVSTQEPIEKMLSWDTPADKQASQASLEMRNIILSKDGYFITVWISSADPRYNYETGRMVIGFGGEVNGIKTVECYGIVSSTTPGEDLKIARRLLDISDCQRGVQIESADQLRSTTICIKPPQDEDLADFVANLIPLTEEIWEEIKNREVQTTKKAKLSRARDVVEEYFERLQMAKTPSEHIFLGAEMERRMGLSAYTDSGCGLTNSQLLSNYLPYRFSYTTIGADKKMVLVHSEEGVFCRECPYCHCTINKVIHPGYRCSCGQIYTGSCSS